jgi:hypothetical protein
LFPDILLGVIAAAHHGPFSKKWEPTLMHLQRQLARLSPRGNLIVAQGSGHYVQNDRPGTVIDEWSTTLRRCFNEDDRGSNKRRQGAMLVALPSGKMFSGMTVCKVTTGREPLRCIVFP